MYILSIKTSLILRMMLFQCTNKMYWYIDMSKSMRKLLYILSIETSLIRRMMISSFTPILTYLLLDCSHLAHAGRSRVKGHAQ